MNFKLLAITGLSLAALPSLAVVAQADGSPWGPFTANIGLTSDYRFRGLQQSQGNVAVSGGVDFTSETGFFAGVWASNVDFNDAADTYLEVDLYGGYTKAFDDKTTGSIKFIYYAYPTSDYPPLARLNDYFEVIGTLSHNFDILTASLEVAASPDYTLESGNGIEVAGTVTVPVTDKFSIFDGGVTASARYGHQWIEDNAIVGTPDYSFYDIGVTAKISNIALDLRWVDTDMSDAECFGGANLCEGGFVATATWYLP